MQAPHTWAPLCSASHIHDVAMSTQLGDTWPPAGVPIIAGMLQVTPTVPLTAPAPAVHYFTACTDTETADTHLLQSAAYVPAAECSQQKAGCI
jgi:hypothetical protein